MLVAVGSILRAQASDETMTPGGLVDAVDPIAITGRSLTQPIQLDYVDMPPDDTPDVVVLATPVTPGEPGPAKPADQA